MLFYKNKKLMFSKSCEYGLRAIVFIARESLNNRKTDIKGVARNINSPEAFTGKILQILSRNKLISSQKGPSGGFWMPLESISKIKIMDVVVVFDGEAVFKRCALGLEGCPSETPCPLHDEFKHIRNDLENLLSSTSIEDLTTKLNSEQYFLKRIHKETKI